MGDSLHQQHSQTQMALIFVQAAYKAVVAKKYSDIKHLNGGVYGEHHLFFEVLHVWRFSRVAMAKQTPVSSMRRSVSVSLQVGGKRIYPLKVSIIWKMLAVRQMLSAVKIEGDLKVLARSH